MSNCDLLQTVHLMHVMAQLETRVADFYGTCAEFFPVNKGFWERLALEETGHAETIGSVRRAAIEAPEMFEAGESSPLEALGTLTSRLNSNLELLRGGRLTEEEALLVAYLVENTFAEHSFTKAIKSKYPSCELDLDRLTADSARHRASVLEKLREQKGMRARVST